MTDINWPSFRYQRMKGKRVEVPYQRLYDAGKLEWNPATHVCAEQISAYFNIKVQRVEIPEMAGRWIESDWGLRAFSVPIAVANRMAPHWQAIRDREDASRKQRKKRPSRAEILRRHREDVEAKAAAAPKTPDKLNVEDAEAGLDATALPESQTSNRRDSRERPAPSWHPQWDRPPKSKFRELKNIPPEWGVRKVVLIWRGEDRQELRVLADANNGDAAQWAWNALLGSDYPSLKKTSVGRLDFHLTREQYDKAGG